MRNQARNDDPPLLGPRGNHSSSVKGTWKGAPERRCKIDEHPRRTAAEVMRELSSHELDKHGARTLIFTYRDLGPAGTCMNSHSGSNTVRPCIHPAPSTVRHRISH